MRRFLQQYGPALLAAAFGVTVFLAMGGGRILPPGNVAWIPPGSDWGYQWVGWLYFRHAPWGLPLGETPGLFWPAGSTLANSDAIPWVGVLAKLLSPILPEPAQYTGLWLCLCFALQGWFGARLVAKLSPSPIAQVAGGALLVLAPVLLQRLRHQALCGHFFILWALAFCFERGERPPRTALVIPALAMGIHPYLAVMSLAILGAALLGGVWAKRWRPLDALGRLGGALALLVGVAALLGYFALPGADMVGEGFGRYNTELYTLINPQGLSRWIRDRSIRGGQPEGYGYLGLGVLVLVATAVVVEIVAIARRRPPLPWRRVAPLLVVTLIFVLFAIATKVSYDGRDVQDLGFLWKPFGQLTATLRSSGRFIWVLVYVLGVGAMAIWLLRFPRLGPWVVAGALALQAADLKSFWGEPRFVPPRAPRVLSPDWELARGEMRHLALYPPRCGDASWVCCPGFALAPRREDMYLAQTAERLGLTYNGFGAARVARTRLRQACRDLDEAVGAGRLDRETIYLVGKDKEAPFRDKNPAAPCARLDGELACLAPEATGSFRARLEASGH